MNDPPIAVFIASHLSQSTRIPFLLECILSLVQQTLLPHIYLSISFETSEIQSEFSQHYSHHPEIAAHYNHIHLFIRSQKTSQMNHFKKLSETSDLPPWILFCDDDDTYAATRVAEFAAAILSADTPIAGAYESTFGKTHEEQRHEYWCYALHRDVLHLFFNQLSDPSVLDHSCCDILFAEFLRRLAAPFQQIVQPLYCYRRENNDTSITGDIVQQQIHEVRRPNPPPITDPAVIDYLLDWNEYLHHHLHFYLHDTFLRTIVGFDFDELLRSEFGLDYPFLDFIDQCHIAKLKGEWEKLRNVCRGIYRISL